jgi:hypothetical protein
MVKSEEDDQFNDDSTAAFRIRLKIPAGSDGRTRQGCAFQAVSGAYVAFVGNSLAVERLALIAANMSFRLVI